METIVIIILVVYSILATYCVGKYHGENQVLTMKNKKQEKPISVKSYDVNSYDDDINRQLGNLFAYNGTSVGQRKKDEYED